MSVAKSRVQTGRTVIATNGVVAAGQRLASAAGVSILRQGGNAIDAAVAAAAVNAVVLPYGTSIGGDLFALVFPIRAGSLLTTVPEQRRSRSILTASIVASQTKVP